MRRFRKPLTLVACLAVALPLLVGLAPSDDAPPIELSGWLEDHARKDDADAREGQVRPSATQRRIVDQLGASRVVWHDLGSPYVLIKHGGYLTGPKEGAAVDVARDFVRQHRVLFRLSEAQVDGLEVLRDSPLYDAPDLSRVYRDGQEPVNPDVAHVVLFRQTFGDLVAARDGMITVGVQRDGRIAWVASSTTADDAAVGEQVLGAIDALRAAATDVGMELGDLTEVATPLDPWTTFESSVLGDVQRARLMALPTPQDGVRLVWEATLLKSTTDDHGHPQAYISFVDAESGKVWLREDRVDNFAAGGHMRALLQQPSGEQFSGETATGACGEDHGPYAVGEGIGTLTATVYATTPPSVTQDLTIDILDSAKSVVAHQDTLYSPEPAVYSPEGGVPPGDYYVRVCPYNATDPPIAYGGFFTASPGGVGDVVALPAWRVFPANPRFTDHPKPSEDTRVNWCWDASYADCVEEQRNLAARLPWDENVDTGPTNTTDGNYASTAISEASFLTPDTAANRPFSNNREYVFPWQNAWFESGCDPTNFGTVADNRNDESASVTNLFVMHNRMHDWSYNLGLTEINSALQKDNFGNTSDSRENDPELGSAQAGRQSVNGRDNANQITLQDGTPGVTNQYLWQPLPGAFYGTCTDGAYDMAIVAHEYGHAISNRMIGGPDAGTGASQGQTESWSDLMFAEYFRGFGIVAAPDANPYALAPLVTGDKKAGIRNYGMNRSPLNYSNLDYDPNGLGSPHANGEIWSAVNYDLSVLLNRKYDATFPSSDLGVQRRCALGELAADSCPGNRRWAQLMFDGFLLQPVGGTMLDSRDSMLAADMLRFDGANQRELWDGFANRGMGADAFSDGVTDVEAKPSWHSPVRDDNATIRFEGLDVGDGVPDRMRVYVGVYEARTVPAADTDVTSELGDTVDFAPGVYEFFAVADGYGGRRFVLRIEAGGQAIVRIPMRRNHASIHNGAAADGDGVNHTHLIDDTETRNWASIEQEGTASEGKGEGALVEGRQVTVDLGGPRQVSDVQVSAMLRPPLCTPPNELTGSEGDCPDGEEPPDNVSQNRFTALRSFDIAVCDASSGASCGSDSGFQTIYRSPDDAFPAVRPRPEVPKTTLRPFDVPDVQATHVRLIVRDNQCTGAPDYQREANPQGDPQNDADCDTGQHTQLFVLGASDGDPSNANAHTVRASELQVFSGAPQPLQVQGLGVSEGAGSADSALVSRLSGSNRFETAASISRDDFPVDGSAAAVVLARGDEPSGFADALAGTPFAVKMDAPLLITEPTALNPTTEQEITRVLAKGRTVYLLGGEKALAPSIERRLQDLGYATRRISGPNRIFTAIEIAEELGNPRNLLITTGFNFPDALAASAAAAQVDGAILLTASEQRDPATDAYIQSVSNERLWAIGGPAARPYAEAKPVYGINRDETAAAVAREFFPAPPAVGIARNDRFPDSLTGGAHIARLGGPMLLTPPDRLEPGPSAYLCDTRSFATEGFVYGGPSALQPHVFDLVAARMAGGGC